MSMKEKQIIDFNQTKRIRLFTELALVVLFFLAVYALTGFVYETQDDFYIESILNGSITGKSEWWMLEYNHPLLMIPLSWLYTVTTTVNWYGLLLILLRAVTCYFVLHGLTAKTKNWARYGLVVILYFGFLLGFYYANTRMQYTSTAGILAISGYACYVLYKDRRGKRILFLVIELFAYALRPNAMMIIVPMGTAILLLLLADEQSKGGDCRLKKLKDLGLAICIVIGIIAVGTITFGLLRINPSIEASANETKARMEIFDYAYHPAYEEVKDILEQKGWTEKKYQAFLQYMILDYDAQDGVLQKIAMRKPADDHSEDNMISIIKKVYKATWSYEIGGITLTVILLWAVAMLVVLCRAKWTYLAVAVAFQIAKIIAWGYTIWIQRSPVRVTLPLMYAEALVAMLIIVLLLVDVEVRKSMLSKVMALAYVLVVLCFICSIMRESYHQIKALRSQKDAENYVSQSLGQCRDYCKEHPENAFILSNEICTFYRKDVLANEITFDNYVLSGDWFAILPDYTDYVQKYLKSKEKCYFLINESIPEFVRNAKLNYLEEYFGYTPVLRDSIDLVSGEKCNVYQVKESDN